MGACVSAHPAGLPSSRLLGCRHVASAIKRKGNAHCLPA